MGDQFKPPEFLDKTGRAEWARILRLLEERDLLDELRVASIQGYCVAYQHWHATEEKLVAAEDPIEIDRLIELSNGHQRRLRDHARDLGMPCNVQVRNKALVSQKDTESTEADQFVRKTLSTTAAGGDGHLWKHHGADQSRFGLPAAAHSGVTANAAIVGAFGELRILHKETVDWSSR
jgi:P27 family predicted phage terminase small subunit